MQASQWEQARDIFDAVLDLPAAERSAFLRANCGDDAALLAEVEALLEADLEAECRSFLDAAWLPDDDAKHPDLSLQPGDRVSGRFRIVRLLGEGGMGRVYEAQDTELKVSVALKTLRSEVATDPGIIRRFQQEVRLAHRITHPNVCRTFHFDRELRPAGDDGSPAVDLTFITMEYLNGDTLQQVMKREGALPPDRALNIARQMADALAAAHRTGIIHRDIKPSNVMLCAPASGSGEAERAVITDFGLAKLDPAVNPGISAISHGGGAMGTLAYMAPEQLTGGPVSSATDVYAFGLVLFEMVTGKRLFPDCSTWSAAMRRTAWDLPSTHVPMPDLPAGWQDAIFGCVQVDPADRFQDACAVIDAIEGSRAQDRRRPQRFGSGAKPSSTKLTTGWRLPALLVFLCALAALCRQGIRLYSVRTQAPVAAGALVYLAPVKNLTGEERLDGVTDLMRTGLEQSAHVNLLSSGKVQDLLQQMAKPQASLIDPPVASEIALRAGAARLILVTLTGAAGSYSMVVDVRRPDSASVTRFRDHWTRTFSWQMPAAKNVDTVQPGLLSQLRSASNWIRLTVGESSDDIERLDAPPEEVTTSSWTAFAAYSSAERYSRAGQTDNAIAELKRAVQVDPQFALAYARLGDLNTSVGRLEEGFHDYQSALDSNFDRRLTRRELDRIRGVYANDTWDYATAENAYRDYTMFYPNDYFGWFRRALPLAKLNRFPEAMKVLERAYALDPQRPNAPHDLAIFSVQTEDLAGAERWIKVLQDQKRQDAVAHMRGILYFLAGDFDKATDAFTRMATSENPSTRLRGLAFLERMAAERGDLPRALEFVAQGMTEAAAQDNGARRSMFLLDRAYLLSMRGATQECLSAARQALALDRSPPTVILAAQLYGQMLQAGAREQHAAVLADLLALEQQLHPDANRVADQLASSVVRTQVLLAKGRWRDALTEARRANTIDSQYLRRPYLVQALQQAAEHEPDASTKAALHNEARDLLARTTLHPAALWIQAEGEAPGVLARDLSAYLVISSADSSRKAETAKTSQALTLLRPTSR